MQNASIFSFRTFQMIIDLAAEEPLAGIICHHLYINKSSWEQTDGVNMVPLVRQDLSMEEGWVDVHLVPHPKQVPVDLIAHAHTEVRQVAVDIPVDSYRKVQRGSWDLWMVSQTIFNK